MRQFITLLFLSFYMTNFAQAQPAYLLNEPSLPKSNLEIVIPKGTQPQQPATHFRSGFSAALQDSFQLALETLLADMGAKGFSATVLADNGDVWKGAAGVSYDGVPMTTDMYLSIGSISKSLTAACMLKLEEEGLLSMSDPISTYLPEFPNVLGSETIEQLLNHTSGIYDFIDHPHFYDSLQLDFTRIWEPEEVLNTFVLNRYFEPGEGWHYSNTNYVLAGLIIEQVTGLDYHTVVRSKLLEPYGLSEMFLNPYEDATGDIAHVWLYIPAFGLKVDLDAAGNTPISLYSCAWAAGSYFARPDLATQWMAKLLKGEVLSPASLVKMKTFVPATNMDYGLGLMKFTNTGHEFIGHQGYIIYSSLCFLDPETNLTVAIQSNDGSAFDMSPFLKKVYQLYNDYYVATVELPVVQGQSYPNPSNEYIVLELPQNTGNQWSVTMTDVSGRRLTAKILSQDSGQIKVDVSHLMQGAYWITVHTTDKNILYSIQKN